MPFRIMVSLKLRALARRGEPCSVAVAAGWALPNLGSRLHASRLVRRPAQAPALAAALPYHPVAAQLLERLVDALVQGPVPISVSVGEILPHVLTDVSCELVLVDGSAGRNLELSLSCGEDGTLHLIRL